MIGGAQDQRARATADVVVPPMEFVDAHVHHWDTGDLEHYPHLAPDYDLSATGIAGAAGMKRHFTSTEYLAVARPWNLRSYVHVDATSAPRAYLWENRHLTELASSTPALAALVGSVDLDLAPGDIEKDLLKQATSPLFRGVRNVHLREIGGPGLARALHVLQDAGLSYDLVAHPDTAEELSRLLARYPDLAVVVEHVGWPTAADKDHFARWVEGLRRLSGLGETVTCKLSGIAMTLHTLTADVIGRWFRAVVETFGVERCMVASNFPVDGIFGSFDTLMSSYLDILRPYGEPAVEAMFAANARRVYRIGA